MRTSGGIAIGTMMDVNTRIDRPSSSLSPKNHPTSATLRMLGFELRATRALSTVRVRNDEQHVEWTSRERSRGEDASRYEQQIWAMVGHLGYLGKTLGGDTRIIVCLALPIEDDVVVSMMLGANRGTVCDGRISVSYNKIEWEVRSSTPLRGTIVRIRFIMKTLNPEQPSAFISIVK